MKILVLAPRPLWPAHDGGTVASLRCISGLAAAGAQVTVLSMKTGKHHAARKASDDCKPDWLSEYRTVHVNTTIRLIPLLLNLLFSGNPYDLTRFRSREYSENLRSLLAGGQFDIIHCEGLVFALYLDEIRRLTSVPVVLRAHNLEHRIREMMADRESSPFRRFYLSMLSRRLKRLETGAACRFDAIVPISRPDSRWFTSEARGRQVFLCETGADEASPLPEPPETPPRVGFIGSMNWKPNSEGIKWFIESVWPSVQEGIPGATLHIAGRDLNKVRTSFPEGKHIVFEGEPDNACSFIASNHVIIAPLFAGSGLRIKIIDAMSCGRPVVATPVAAEGIESRTDCGLAVAADAESFSSAVLGYLEDDGLRSSAGKAAVKLIREKYDNRSLTAGLLEFYRDLADKSAADGIKQETSK